MKRETNKAEEFFNTGNEWRKTGNYEKAIENYKAALDIQPDFFAAHANCGAALSELGYFSKALHHFTEAVRIKPDLPEAHNNLGLTLLRTGSIDKAIDHFRKAIAHRPHSAAIYTNLGKALEQKGRYKEAEAQFNRAIHYDGNFVPAYIGLGNTFACQRVFTRAKEAFYRALKLKPSSADAWYGLGTLMREQHHLDESVMCYKKAIGYNPRSVMALNNCGEALQESGCIDEAESLYDKALQIDPHCEIAYGNKIYCMNYNPRYSPQQIFEAHQRWGEIFGTAAPLVTCHQNDRSPEKKLRVGYVSPDFCRHPASYFFEPLFTCRSKEQYEIYGYSQTTRVDTRTEYFQSLADHWLDITEMSDQHLACKILEDRIDILVDLAGHTAGNRLRVFAPKPAPIQISFLGYPNTSGVPAVDVRFTDDIADPEGSDNLYTESLVRLKSGFCCYAPPDFAPPVSPLPAVENDFVTFGSTHSLSRLNFEVLNLWGEILRAVPHSKLLILRNTLSENIQQRYKATFKQLGIPLERIILQKKIPGAGHLAAYHHIDIALDTYPWSGHTTACEALWMGVPVVTLLGNRHAGRMVASVVTRAGFPQLVARSREDYLQKARELSQDIPALSSLRSKARETMSKSTLCNGPQFTQAVENEYRVMWRKWCSDREESPEAE
ncbi:MAG: tetratricopeptide repeat protein [Chitinivibrionales bacterium]|nr:tetratricopeptide repeat protein [Chitinivibrionales bacterium]